MLVYAPGLIGELLTFLMLFGRAWLLLVGLAVIAMHALVEITMNLGFSSAPVDLPYSTPSIFPSGSSEECRVLPFGLRRHPA